MAGKRLHGDMRIQITTIEIKIVLLPVIVPQIKISIVQYRIGCEKIMRLVVRKRYLIVIE